MDILTTIKSVKEKIADWKKDNKTIGLVPTMGYLHNGHGSLVNQSVKDNDKTIVSIFVNPTQFGVGEDLDAYPRDFERDKAFLEHLNADAVFYPSVDEMYNKNHFTKVYVENMSSLLCGSSRPNHFEGVTTVVTKLFNITSADKAYFGSKDFQQLQIIKKMVEDLNFNIEIIGMPIIRDVDGLALSSRNVYLNENERKSALSLHKALQSAKQLVDLGKNNTKEIIKDAEKIINSEKCIKIDYIKIVDVETLKDIDFISKASAMLIAAYIGKARLIDNMIIKS